MPPMSLLIKPASGNCNMNCKYCFYADEMRNRETPSYGMMSLNTLENIVRKTLQNAERHCTIAFQGGEPTLVGLDFYKHLIEFEEKYKKSNQVIHHNIQTNGYSLDADWAEFFVKHNFLVGLSVDGTKEIHNANRLGNDGKDTFNKIMRTVELFKSKGVEFNTLTVVTSKSATHANQIYSFFKRNGLDYQQYIACLPPIGEENNQINSITASQYGIFLKDLFQQWYIDKKHGRSIYIRYFENLLQMLAGNPPESCGMSGSCCNQWVVEANGSVFPCDFYVLDKWELGNFNSNSVEEIGNSLVANSFINNSTSLPDECKNCQWGRLCNGGCKRERLISTKDQPPKNMFCQSYKEFFTFAVPRLLEILSLI